MGTKHEVTRKKVIDALEMFGDKGVGIETLALYLLGRADADARYRVSRHVAKLRVAGEIDGDFRGKTGRVRYVQPEPITDRQVEEVVARPITTSPAMGAPYQDVDRPSLKKLLTDIGDCASMMSDLADEATTALAALDDDSQMATGIRALMEKYGVNRG